MTELSKHIRAEIKEVEDALALQRAALQECQQSEKWDIEVRLRSLRGRLLVLHGNLYKAVGAYGRRSKLLSGLQGDQQSAICRDGQISDGGRNLRHGRINVG